MNRDQIVTRKRFACEPEDLHRNGITIWWGKVGNDGSIHPVEHAMFLRNGSVISESEVKSIILRERVTWKLQGYPVLSISPEEIIAEFAEVGESLDERVLRTHSNMQEISIKLAEAIRNNGFGELIRDIVREVLV